MNLMIRNLYRTHFRKRLLRVLIWVRLHIPPGLRLILGVLLMIGGVFSILPFLGLWMLPAGFYVAALDILPLWRWMRGRRRPVTSVANPSIHADLSHPASEPLTPAPGHNPHKV
ncbi:hypothetical protein FIU94_10670 [Sulfitobacter sp. THAF37]|uniref:hypothetical protein n=1 Tax=Sulfitobacter sp. THAF37 TaxID=2587855 RepID=UPI0012A7BBA7|nr:hypothetical protein [Sulfitobacter sp. THAF37]QFT59288.1 hypothetical protein FIU94_10670 [Sulfitobacter sp. THAF37]